MLKIVCYEEITFFCECGIDSWGNGPGFGLLESCTNDNDSLLEWCVAEDEV